MKFGYCLPTFSFPDLDFDPAKALVPVATLVTWSHVLAVAPSVPATTIKELVAHAKAHPKAARNHPLFRREAYNADA